MKKKNWMQPANFSFQSKVWEFSTEDSKNSVVLREITETDPENPILLPWGEEEIDS